jgi:hypothetical protein
MRPETRLRKEQSYSTYLLLPSHRWKIIKQGSHQNSICRNSLYKSPFMIPTCNWRRNSPQPGAEEENWVIKQAGIITSRQQTPVVLLKTNLRIEWIACKSIYVCLHVAVQQIQDVLTASQCPIFFSHSVRRRASKGSHVTNFLHLWFVLWFRQKSIIIDKWRIRKNAEGNGCDLSDSLL